MRGVLALTLVAAAGAACGGGGPGGSADVGFDRLVSDPGAFSGRAVRVQALYFEDPQVRVLTQALAESYPPQAVGASIWVETRAPEGDCVTSDLGVTWGEVVARGTFRYSAGGGLGVPPIYSMALDDATLVCP